MVIESILVGILGNSAYDILKNTFKDICGQENIPIYDNIYKALETCSQSFFQRYDKKYGKPSESFLAREENVKLIMRSMYYGSNINLKNELNRKGYGDIPELTDEDFEFFICELNKEMSKDFQLDKVLTGKAFISEQRKGQQALDLKIDKYGLQSIELGEKILQALNAINSNNIKFEKEDTIKRILESKAVDYHESKILRIDDTSGQVHGIIQMKPNDFIQNIETPNELFSHISLNQNAIDNIDCISLKIYIGQDLIQEYEYEKDYTGPIVEFGFTSHGPVEIIRGKALDNDFKGNSLTIVPAEIDPTIYISLEDENFITLISNLPLYIQSRQLISDGLVEVALSNIGQKDASVYIKITFTFQDFEPKNVSFNVHAIDPTSAYSIMHSLVLQKRLYETEKVVGRSKDNHSIVFEGELTFNYEMAELESDIQLIRTILNIEKRTGIQFKIPQEISAEEIREIYEFNDAISKGVILLPPMTCSSSVFPDFDKDLISEDSEFLISFIAEISFCILGIDFDLGEAVYVIPKAKIKHFSGENIEFESSESNLCVVKKYYGDYSLEQIMDRELHADK